MVDSVTPRSWLMVPSRPTGMSSVVMAKNVARPRTAIPITDDVVTVIGVVCGCTVRLLVVDTAADLLEDVRGARGNDELFDRSERARVVD
ncbi:hypothetical protein GCM10009627_10340 [Curtobacterium herbarum]|uniref:CBS domain-containing protein n=1 Tax=Curtobacterium herbarum TaxID=150122 RepID=A0ABN1ZAS8_9MICO